MQVKSDLQRAVPQTFSVADLLEWYRNDLLDLSPRFQRRSVWKPLAKSFLIDTILRGLPVPMIILRELPTNLKTLARRREVVDGQQRLRTLFAFVLGGANGLAKDAFSLSAAHQPEFGNFAFDDLPEDSRTIILEYKLHVSVLPPTTTDPEVLSVFSRLNATGTNLKDQELRNAEFYGYFKTVSYELGAEFVDFWLRHKLFTAESFSRMMEVQFTSQLLGVLIEGPKGLTQRYLNELYKKNDDNSAFARSGPVRFRQIINFLDRHFPWEDLHHFSRTSLFYPLFSVVHEHMPDSPKKSWEKSTRWSAILKQAKLLQARSVPTEVLDAITSQPTNLKERLCLIGFLSVK